MIMNTIEEPRKRFSELDVVRAIALLFLPVIHVYEEMELIGTLSAEALSSCKWVLALCVFAPSVFMICFGANLFFAKEKSPAEYAKRGLKFLLIGVGLNVARLLLPSFISLAMVKPGRVMNAVNNILACDIYDFVGAFLLVFALFKKLRLSGFAMLLVSMLMLLLNTVIPPVQLEACLAFFSGASFTWMRQAVSRFSPGRYFRFWASVSAKFTAHFKQRKIAGALFCVFCSSPVCCTVLFSLPSVPMGWIQI